MDDLGPGDEQWRVINWGHHHPSAPMPTTSSIYKTFLADLTFAHPGFAFAGSTCRQDFVEQNDPRP